MANAQQGTYHDTVTSRSAETNFTSPTYDSAPTSSNYNTSETATSHSAQPTTTPSTYDAPSSSSNYNTTDSITPASNIQSSNGLTDNDTQAPRRTSFAEPASSSAITYSGDAGTDATGTARRASYTPHDSVSGGSDTIVNPSTTTDPLNAHHRPSIAEVSPDDQVQGLKGDTTIRRASLAQNAPGKAGEVGENVLGAFGAGGSSVERPLKDQGIGEKIVNFLGF